MATIKAALCSGVYPHHIAHLDDNAPLQETHNESAPMLLLSGVPTQSTSAITTDAPFEEALGRNTSFTKWRVACTQNVIWIYGEGQLQSILHALQTLKSCISVPQCHAAILELLNTR